MEAILSSRVECRTVSKALLKSSAMTTTYELHESSSVTDWRMATIAAVVDPVAMDGRHTDPHNSGGREARELLDR